MELGSKIISFTEGEYFIFDNEVVDKKLLNQYIKETQCSYVNLANKRIEVELDPENKYHSIKFNGKFRKLKEQSSYNMPKRFIDDIKERFFELYSGDKSWYNRDESDEVYFIKKGCKFELGPSAQWLIGDKIGKRKNYGFVLSYPTEGKIHPQLYKTVYDKIDEKYGDFKWFMDLYERNIAGNELILKIQENVLILDIKLKSIEEHIPLEWLFPEDDFLHNKIFFGAPGTGKSHNLDKQKIALLERNKENFERVTFHPDYSYAQFVGTYKPISTRDRDGKDIIQYKYVPGPFLRILVDALNNPNENYLLIIEEINRSNVAAVFGDVFQLLDRDDDNFSKYPIETSEDMRKFLRSSLIEGIDYKKLKIPNNMYIWATMNSADQGVYMMDTAFKRRWDFEYIGIDKSESKINHAFIRFDDKEIHWNSLRKAINNNLSSLNINEDKLLGPFFISPKYFNDNQKFLDNFKNKVLMYLYEDVAKGRKNIYREDIRNKDHVLFSDIISKYEKEGIFIFSNSILLEYNNFVTKEKFEDKRNCLINIDFEIEK